MQLLIMRHGEAEVDAVTDSQRALTAKGQSDAFKAGQWIAAQSYRPERLLVSPYRRTQETAIQLLNTLNGCIENAPWITPDATAIKVFKQLEQCPEQSLMLVSHQPLVGELMALLVDERAASRYPFAPSTVMVLQGEMLAIGAMQVERVFYS